MYISKKNVNKIQDALEMSGYHTRRYIELDRKETEYFNDNHSKSNDKIGDCEFWIEYKTLKLDALRQLREAYNCYSIAKNNGVDVQLFPYTIDYVINAIKDSEFEELEWDIEFWENRKETFLNKEVA
tara:strand:- start:3020 stop:3400 length:381 start_codon:yes stop_codon:yes gene_type:complete